MARIRTIKPEFFTSEDVVALSPLARLLYIGLWCEADREGRISWKPRTLKMRYLPADDCDVFSLANELIQTGLVMVYLGEDGSAYACIPTFHKHQSINVRESQSAIPAPDFTCKSLTAYGVAHSDTETHVNDDARTDLHMHARARTDINMQGGGEGKEGKGREHLCAPSSRLSGFDLFYAAYPKKRNRGDAEKAWAKLNPNEEMLALILSSLEKATACRDWQRDGGQFIPYPASWLNAKGWEDEFSPPLRLVEADPYADLSPEDRAEALELDRIMAERQAARASHVNA